MLLGIFFILNFHIVYSVQILNKKIPAQAQISQNINHVHFDRTASVLFIKYND